MNHRFEQDIVAQLVPLRRFALSLCRNPDLADDLVQMTVERAIAACDRYDGSQRIEPWLFRILRNAWLDMLRRRRTRGTEIDVSDAPDAAAIDGRQITDARLMLSATEKALDELPDDQREVILLVCYEELSYAEAAAILDIPRGTVMSRLARGRVALAKKLGI
ncbi:RNA polymerase sigma factor [Celeribacter persicus]|uniref:RNA polymerase sigma-70 factor (ECF subfamily) n=1 Tax=Celeribacter persicus TaxID=1651082 RepID=A0A2T5HSN4_9RHOB|nr:RNA polymerase sigma factor [Celeribacter persicus]PTQ74603.1 RNA polymerase sigma-70 factor (ECF subfamily) [Celeribacter persicus]